MSCLLLCRLWLKFPSTPTALRPPIAEHSSCGSPVEAPWNFMSSKPKMETVDLKDAITEVWGLKWFQYVKHCETTTRSDQSSFSPCRLQQNHRALKSGVFSAHVWHCGPVAITGSLPHQTSSEVLIT